MKSFVSLKDKYQIAGPGVTTAGNQTIVPQRLEVPAKPGAAAQDAQAPGGGGLPDGLAGEILYHNGTDWVVLANPGTPSPSTNHWVLRHNGTAPYWDALTQQSLVVIVGGTNYTGKFYLEGSLT